jgi:uncharacterized protein
VNSIQYTLSNSSNLAQDARNLAMQDAARKAKELAILAGVKLGDVLMITDASYLSPAPMPMYDMATSAAPASAGQLAISTTISVRYEILQAAE